MLLFFAYLEHKRLVAKLHVMRLVLLFIINYFIIIVYTCLLINALDRNLNFISTATCINNQAF